MTYATEAIWTVNPNLCIGCGDCTAICPVHLFDVTPPPCQSACPIDTDVTDYVSLIKQGKFSEALASISELHPFAGTLGRICNRPCETDCSRGSKVDKAIPIRALKRAAADYGQFDEKTKPAPKNIKQERVAIVGSGPAGLVAAYDLAREGYKVTVFEALPVAGGMLQVGIPSYRLPREVLENEIGLVKDLGVEFKFNTTVGKDVTIDDLFQQGYQAVLLATGAHQGMKLPLPGSDLEGVLVGVSFLKDVSTGRQVKLGEKVLVLGGGDVAFDCARTALRLGAKEVRVACLEDESCMLASDEESRQGQEEGIILHRSHTFSKIVSDNGCIKGVECLDVRHFEFDASGRVQIDAVSESVHILPADTVIFAIGQKPDVSYLSDKDGIDVSEARLIVADPVSLATARPGVFAAGDNVSGSASMVDALAAGKRAAVSISRFISEEDLKEGRTEREKTPIGEKVWWAEEKPGERSEVPELSADKRSGGFDEVELGFSRESAITEANACLECIYFAHMDIDSCCKHSCRICERQCPTNAIEAY